MARMAGRRTLSAVPVLLAVTFGVFAVAALSPFDPVKAYAGTAGLTASQAELDQLRANLGVDRPFPARWWDWLTSALTGDLGDSAVMRQPVADVIAERVGWSALLAGSAFAVAVLLGTLLGLLAARRQGGALDRAASGLAYTLEAAPAFWLGLLAVWFFSVRLGALPSGGLPSPPTTPSPSRGSPPTWCCPHWSSASPSSPGSSSTYARASPTPWPKTPYAAPARGACPSGGSCWATGCAPACCPCSPSSAPASRS
ncbi:transport permease [Streptomyces sp. C]|nr:transport permease [Streptomyces sp. C]